MSALKKCIADKSEADAQALPDRVNAIAGVVEEMCEDEEMGREDA